MTSPVRRLATLAIATVLTAALLPVPAVNAASELLDLYGLVQASDWTSSVHDEDVCDTQGQPACSRDGWSGVAQATRTDSTSIQTYRVSATGTADIDPTLVAADVRHVAVSSRSRVETSLLSCSAESACAVSGHAAAEVIIWFQLTTSARVRVEGTFVRSLTVDGGGSSNDCSFSLAGPGIALGVGSSAACPNSSNGATPILFDETVPAGIYRLDASSWATTHAYSWQMSSFSEVSMDLTLDIDPPVTDPASVAFDWVMPDRFGQDTNSDGLIDYLTGDVPTGSVTPSDGWQVDFTARDTPAGCDTSRTRRWAIDGTAIVAGNSRAPGLNPSSCSFRYLFPNEGVHSVELEVYDGATLLGSRTQSVTVQDWLVVSLGDSVASGEGNPDRPQPGTSPERWQSQQCHRTALAGPAQAALALERADPRTSVTFVHLACSGATIRKGLIGAYDGIEPATPLPPQLDALVNLAGGREIDAITVSIGANDVKFSKVVARCVVHPSCHNDTWPFSGAALFDDLLPALPGWYDKLQQAFQSRALPTDRVFITEYFDPTRDDDGTVCERVLDDGPGTDSMYIDRTEATWATQTMLPALNGQVRDAATRHGWRFVGGIRDAYLTHGYCADSPWIVTWDYSHLVQGDQNGTIHPNVPGHAHYGSRIAEALRGQLYDLGDLTKPRRPAS